MNRKYYALFLVLLLGFFFTLTFYNLAELGNPSGLNQHYIAEGVKDTGAINLVTAILFDYRGFDTLGEATVILAAAAALSFLVPKKRIPMLATRFTIIVYQAIALILPIMVLLGFYLIVFGHLSPGGGFTGGVVLATIPILLTITYGISLAEDKFNYRQKAILESSGALTFVLLGLLGILTGSAFLASGQTNLSLGIPGNLISSGLIPYFNLAVGLKVSAGLAIIFNSLIKED